MMRKTRMVSFRLSDDEYCGLKSLCEAQGARSISDLARAALQNLLTGGNCVADAAVRSRLDALDGRITLLDLAVERLAQLVESGNDRSV